MARNNQQIWRIAKWLWDRQLSLGGWYVVGEEVRNYYYDTATLFLKSLNSGYFTGDDNHND